MYKNTFMRNKGITLVALVITIIVLLLLSGISISMVTGQNGIIKNSNNAKEQTEIANEKDIVQIAVVGARGKEKYGDLTQENLQSQLDKEQEGKTEVNDIGDELEVVFIESNRYYVVEKDGGISEPQEIVKDNNPGDITKGGTLDGSEEKPYEINCIEDLVAFSKSVKENSNNRYKNKNVYLNRNLNFKSKYSYTDYTTTKFGDVNEDGNIEGLMKELSSGIGFEPIGSYKYNETTKVFDVEAFAGTFDGKRK